MDLESISLTAPIPYGLGVILCPGGARDGPVVHRKDVQLATRSILRKRGKMFRFFLELSPRRWEGVYRFQSGPGEHLLLDLALDFVKEERHLV